MFTELNSILDLEGSGGCPEGDSVLILDAGSDASCFLHHFISAFLRQNRNVCLLALAQSFNHYNSVGNKLGVSLSNLRHAGNLIFLESVKLVAESLQRSEPEDKLVNFDSESHGALRNLFLLVKESLESLKVRSNTLLVIDDLSTLLHIGVPTLDIIYFMQYVRNLVKGIPGGCLVVSSQESKTDEDMELLARQLEHQSDLVFRVEGLPSGYSKDVHGQLVVKWQNHSQTKYQVSRTRLMQFKVLDKSVQFFAKGMSSAVL